MLLEIPMVSSKEHKPASPWGWRAMEAQHAQTLDNSRESGSRKCGGCTGEFCGEHLSKNFAGSQKFVGEVGGGKVFAGRLQPSESQWGHPHTVHPF